jgi:hypothetical protein
MAWRPEGEKMSDKKTAAARREADAWRARVLFLCFHSLRDVTRQTKIPVSSVARWVADDRLEAVRTRHELRIPALIALHKASPKGFSRFIETEMERLPATASNTRALREFRRDNDVVLEQIMPERIVVLRRGRKEHEGQFNEASCALSWLLHKTKISQWAYDAGMKYRTDVEISQSFRGQDPAKENVSGGGGAGTISDGQADAIDRLSEVREAVALSVTGGVKGLYWGIAKEACLKMDARRADRLAHVEIAAIAKVLESVAWVYNIAPSGHVATFLSNRAINGRLRRKEYENA